ENIGSGFPLILSAWNEKHWLKPELIEQPELMQVKLILHIEDKVRKPLVSKDETKDVRKDVRKELSERQLIILNLIKTNVRIKIDDMSRMLKVNEKTIRRDLANLQEKGFIKREGGRKDGQWVIHKK
ncbi:MAG: DeoR family transcriptional regulator, partial [Bacteroidaceae bacterium]